MRFLLLMKSERYQALHTPLWLVHLMIPVLGTILFTWYYSFSAMEEMDKVPLYLQVLTGVYPILIGVITAMFAEREQGAAGCQMLLSYPGAKCVPHLAKLAIIFLLGLCSCVIAVVGFGLGFRSLGYTLVSMMDFLAVSVFLFLSAVPLYLIHYMVSFFLGKGYSIGLGIAGSLVSLLMLTGLGDGLWWLMPWGILARYSYFYLRSDWVDIRKGSLALCCFFVILFTVQVLSFAKWEGKKAEE